MTMRTQWRIVYEGKPGASGCSANRASMTISAASEEECQAYMSRHLPNVAIVRICRVEGR